jgi:hypothetical protein
MHVYSTADSRTSALGTIAVMAVVFAIAANAISEKFDLGPAWLISAPTVAAVYGLLYQVLDRIAWRWEIVRRLGLVDTPLIDGTYEGLLISSYQQKEVSVRLRIDQTWTKISIRLEVLGPARTSTSYSVTAGLGRDGHQDARLTYTYRNQTRPGVADADMNDHDGTAEIVIDGQIARVSGRYYNFRGRQGTISLERQ